jgi:hypothetical protein
MNFNISVLATVFLFLCSCSSKKESTYISPSESSYLHDLKTFSFHTNFGPNGISDHCVTNLTIKDMPIQGAPGFSGVEFDIDISVFCEKNLEFVNELLLETIFLNKGPALFTNDMVKKRAASIGSMTGDDGLGLNWYFKKKSSFTFKNSDFVCINYSEEGFSGGAHPWHSSKYIYISLKTKQLISFKALVGEGVFGSITKLSEKEFRLSKRLGFTKPVRLLGFTFPREEFSLPENIGIDSMNSLRIFFNEYEISIYADGPTELRIKL